MRLPIELAMSASLTTKFAPDFVIGSAFGRDGRRSSPFLKMATGLKIILWRRSSISRSLLKFEVCKTLAKLFHDLRDRADQ